ncbi:E3 ubiquitin-protein ligase rnf8 [Balamuthia mandrillaris]
MKEAMEAEEEDAGGGGGGEQQRATSCNEGSGGEQKTNEVTTPCLVYVGTIAAPNGTTANGATASLLSPPKFARVDRPVFKIGRGQRANMLLDSPSKPCMVSRIHALIQREAPVVGADCSASSSCSSPYVWRLVDCNSLNGVFVNRVRVKEAILKEGDEIIFGEGGRSVAAVDGKDANRKAVAFGERCVVSDPELVYIFRLNCDQQEAGTEGKESKGKEIEKEEVLAEEQEETNGATRHPELQRHNNGNKRKRQEDDRDQGKEERKEGAKGEVVLKRCKTVEKGSEAETERLKAELARKEKELAEHLEQMEALRNAIQMEKEAKSEQERQWQTSLEEKMTALMQQFEEQKQLLEKEKETKESEYEAEKRKLQEELEKQRSEAEALKEKSICKDELEEEFTCSICQGLMIHATALECSHTFCGECLSNWLLMKMACPVCRCEAKQTPVRARSLDNIISKIVDKLPSEEKEDWLERERCWREQEQALQKLEKQIAEAKARNLKFLNIAEPWNAAEKKVFLDGATLYSSGRTRRLYCSMTGLTPEFVQQCSIPTLLMAASNLGIDAQIGAAGDTSALRRRLLDFISLPTQPSSSTVNE